MPEFDPRVSGCEVPVGLGVFVIAVELPSGDFDVEGLLVGDAAVEALGGENTEFKFRHVQPTPVLWCVVPLEPFDEPAGFGGRKGFVQRCWLVRVQVILDENDFWRPGKCVSDNSLSTWA